MAHVESLAPPCVSLPLLMPPKRPEPPSARRLPSSSQPAPLPIRPRRCYAGPMAATKNPTANGFQPWDTAQDAAVAKFVEFAKSWSTIGLSVRQAKARLDENRDGEPVMRVQLLLTDPDGSTWDSDRADELEEALDRKATELGLPFVSLNLIAEREPSANIFA